MPNADWGVELAKQLPVVAVVLAVVWYAVKYTREQHTAHLEQVERVYAQHLKSKDDAPEGADPSVQGRAEAVGRDDRRPAPGAGPAPGTGRVAGEGEVVTEYFVVQSVGLALVVLTGVVALRRYAQLTAGTTGAILARAGAPAMPAPDETDPTPDADISSAAARQAAELLPMLMRLRRVRWQAEVGGNGLNVIIMGGKPHRRLKVVRAVPQTPRVRELPSPDPL